LQRRQVNFWLIFLDQVSRREKRWHLFGALHQIEFDRLSLNWLIL